MRSEDIKTNAKGFETLIIHRATATLVSQFLNPDIAHVWILGHWPHNSFAFHEATVPLSLTQTLTGRVRALSYDIDLPTAKFLDRATDFDGHGLTLFQSKANA